ncbi:hypothetical protein PoB_003781200 [Plakobranchus ocellatus]|uniref:Uncharacterized protein n=1 Tax=Plakobranchus ocellatus TaxID=259542 RepID=A0AAV4AW83_9GAST|nr:hypothetical protein PoB_003781200 [Plakobranchus ocellatus]
MFTVVREIVPPEYIQCLPPPSRHGAGSINQPIESLPSPVSTPGLISFGQPQLLPPPPSPALCLPTFDTVTQGAPPLLYAFKQLAPAPASSAAPSARLTPGVACLPHPTGGLYVQPELALRRRSSRFPLTAS